MTDHTQTSAPPHLNPLAATLHRFARSRTFWGIAGSAAAAAAAAALAAAYLPPGMALAAALSTGCLGLWASAAVPEYWTALAFFLAAVATAAAPAEVIFSGFHSSTFWLLFSGLVLGAAIKHTGLDQRAAALLMRLPFRTYPMLIAGITGCSMALAFLVPSSIGRIMILMPVISALAGQLGFAAGAKGRTGMLTAAAFATFAPAFTILPANAPNMILAGMSETLYGVEISYWTYLKLHFPVLGLLKSALIAGLVLVMFPDRLPERGEARPEAPAPVTLPQWQLMAILGLCLALWLSDELHGISPAWIGLAAALACLWPRAGLTARGAVNTDLSYGALLFVAGIMGLGAVIASAGLGEALVAAAGGFAGFSPETPVRNLAVLTGLSTLVAMATNLPGVPAVMTPLGADLAQATGLPLQTVLMTQVLAFSNVFLPFQAPPLVAAIQAGRIPARAVVRMCLILFTVSLLVLVPLDFLWWRVLGVL
ncbi:SLC13 family permease [Cribrihabitans neustonicus]|uniref:SLC13 family permease n=1 Tax=Cribrihabitans neustonicus TaxID=1429085 RepID=UPI003B5B0555